jgi:hypothetical protein
MTPALRLTEVAGDFSICRLPPDTPIPTWPGGEFVSISCTRDELSIVCASSSVPAGVQCETDWRCVRVEGPIPFEVTGVAARLTAPLAAAGIPLFLVSTYDTDYLLVKNAVYERALVALATEFVVER